MKEYNKCIDVCSMAMTHDKDGKNTREIEAQSQKALQAQYEAREGESEEQAQERIQRDPVSQKHDLTTTGHFVLANLSPRISWPSSKIPSCNLYSNKPKEVSCPCRRYLALTPVAVLERRFADTLLIDPKALQDHMRNPEIRNKIQKLMAAGVIRMGR